jgi:HSP20 family protein
MAITRWSPLDGNRTWAPPIDVYEKDDTYVVQVELPGMDPSNIDVTVENGVLSIRGERRFEDKLEDENARRIERRFGAFLRQLSLPTEVDADKIDANYRDGILTVTVPKVEAAKPKRITVKASA